MGARGRTCPACQRTWAQRHARFCGVCGVPLHDRGRSAPLRWSTRTLVSRGVGAAIVAFVAVLVVTTQAVDRIRPASPTVDVDDDTATSASPLSDDQVALLREQADPTRLRCEPRGCEAWRLLREGMPMASGAVGLGNGLVLLLLGAGPSGSAAHDGDADRLVAIDPASGEQRWARPVTDYRSISGAHRWVRLLAGPDGGALVLSGTTITAIGPDGEERWTAIPPEAGIAARDVWDAVTTDASVLVTGTLLDRTTAAQHLTAVDPATGAVRWTVDVAQVVHAGSDSVVVIEPNGALRGLDEATGEPRWLWAGPVLRARPAGPWLAVQETTRLHLVDPATGTPIATAEGWLTSALVAAGDRWVGTMRAISAADDQGASFWTDESGPMEVVAFDADGQVAWSEPLGRNRPWWDCCPLSVDLDAGVVTVADPARLLHHDLETGRLVDARVTARRGDTSRNGGLSAPEVWHPEHHVEVAALEGGNRIDIRTADGSVTVRSGRGLRVESIDPLVVTDGRELIGLQVGAGD